MKTFFLIFSIFIFGCSSDDTTKEESNNIPQELLGKWKIVEVYETDGGSEPQWRDENTGAIYDYWFKSEGSFLQSDGAINGSYIVDENNDIELTINSVKKYHIEYLTFDSLIIDLLNFEPLKVKYVQGKLILLFLIFLANTDCPNLLLVFSL